MCPVGHGGFSLERIDDYFVLYDCGSSTSPEAVEACIDNLQQYTDHINVFFISHFDNDHVNCIRYLLNKVQVLKVVTSYIPSELRTAYNVYTNNAYNTIMGVLKDNNIEVEAVGGEDEQRKYYFQRDIWVWFAKSMITTSDFNIVTTSLQNRGVVLDKLKEENTTYLESQRENINNAFKDAFGPKGPNSKGLIVLSQKSKDIKTWQSLMFQRCKWCYKTPSLKASYQSSCLYVGDADLKNRKNKKDVKDFMKRNKTEPSLLLMQIPHHGSKYNVGASFESDFASNYYFMNDITDNRIRKNVNLYNSLMAQKKLLIVRDNCCDMIVTKTEIK